VSQHFIYLRRPAVCATQRGRWVGKWEGDVLPIRRRPNALGT